MTDRAAALTGAQFEAVPVRRIEVQDLERVLKRGLEDFRRKPSHLIFLYMVYPVAALILSRIVFGYELLPLLFPLAAGFALVGPFAALGLYELSRRLEQDGHAEWQHAFSVIRSPVSGSILLMGGILAVIFLAWLLAAMGIYQLTMGGYAPSGVGDFLARIFTTPGGWALIILGNAVGFPFAALAFSVSVVSFPLLLDRNVRVSTAIATSIRAVQVNCGPLTVWG